MDYIDPDPDGLDDDLADLVDRVLAAIRSITDAMNELSAVIAAIRLPEDTEDYDEEE